MKRVLSILISLCAIVSAYAQSTVVEIWNKGQLETVRTNVNNGDLNYEGITVKLMTDLDLGSDWISIGTQDVQKYSFMGTFDGQGYTITYSASASSTVLGLFGYFRGTVQHLKVRGSVTNTDESTTNSTAGIVAYNRGTIRECANLASIVGRRSVGGIAGVNKGIITNCYNRGYIGATGEYSGGYHLGGIAGEFEGTELSNVYACCTIEEVSSTGGIVANNISGNYSNCHYAASGTTTLTGNALKSYLNNSKWTFTDGELPELTCFKNKIVRLVDNYDNTAALSCNNGQMCTVELTNRTLYKDAAWNTLCLPFELSSAQTRTLLGSNGHLMELDVDGKYSDEAGQIPDVDGAYQTGFDYESGSLNIYFKNATSIEAGKPYIIKWDSGDNLESHSFSNVTIANATNVPVITSSDGKVSFIGNYSPVTLLGGDQSNLYMGTGIDNKGTEDTSDDETYSTLYYPSKKKTIYSCRAYFHVDFPEAPDPNELHIRVYFEDEEGLTDVKEVRGVHEVKDDTWYTLYGVKLEGKPSVPGVFIYNGRKVMIQ